MPGRQSRTARTEFCVHNRRPLPAVKAVRGPLIPEVAGILPGVHRPVGACSSLRSMAEGSTWAAGDTSGQPRTPWAFFGGRRRKFSTRTATGREKGIGSVSGSQFPHSGCFSARLGRGIYTVSPLAGGLARSLLKGLATVQQDITRMGAFE